MSAGAFTRSRYAASYGSGTEIHPIRVQPETIACTIGGVANTAPTGALTNPISAVVSRGSRAKGLRPRLVALKAPATGQPATYAANGITVIPCLTEAFYNAAVAADDTTTVSYNGVAGYKVSYTSAEEAR